MAHNIWNDGQTDAVFCVGDRKAAWHELGQRTENTVTWNEAMRLANLQWDVVLMPLATRKPSASDVREHGRLVRGAGDVVRVDSHCAIMRQTDGAILGVVGSDYQPIQNRYAFEFVDSILEAENGAHYESAGALGMGERIWCLARVPGSDFKVAGVDPHQTYLLFTTSHDGSMSAVAKLTDVRVVCQNTLTSALSHNGTMARVRHTKNAEYRLDQCRRMMQGVAQDAKTLADKLNTLAESKLTRESLTAIIDRLFPKPAANLNQTRRENTVSEVLGLFESNDKNAIPSIRGTAYNLLNAVTEFTDHYRTARVTDGRKLAGYTVTKARAENALFGTGESLKSGALATILEVVSGKSQSESAVAVAEPEPEVTPEQQTAIDSIVRRTLGM